MRYIRFYISWTLKAISGAFALPTSRKSSGALADKIPPATEASGASGPLFNALHYSLSLAYFSVFIESFLLRFSLNSHQEIKTCRSQKWKQEIQW